MGWLPEPPKPCAHPTRPKAEPRDEGRLWECDDCTAVFRVEVIHYEQRDINLGEPSAEASWRRA